ncbi:hypothetical protein LGK95_02645 [Clostridium algoriphilum]|uniref:HNH endonuclease n=1 Tax=Clostridium algoriphilum TaxID=198347 RepID=UPI001CF2F03A|nr:HNH endonuclease [Clostridium algoriphilum]MCB2292438.1 hypothetical protein [Clostridium algoriphilum]
MNAKILEAIAIILVEYARNHKTITYIDLSKGINNAIRPVKLGDPLGEISVIAHELGLPLISVLVINSTSRLPGDGYYPLASQLHGISEDQAMNDFEKEIDDCKQCKDWNKLLEYFSGKSENSKTIAEISSKVTVNDDYEEILQEVDTIENETVEQKSIRIKRNQRIVYDLKEKYKNKCQIEGCGFTFKKKDGNCYSEAHHLDYLSKGGKQVANNMVILCANHHRMFHYADVKISDMIKGSRKVYINGEGFSIKYIC